MNCAICGYEKTIDLRNNDIVLKQCPNCGIVFGDLQNIDYSLNEYYKTQYIIKENDDLFADVRRISAFSEQIFLLSIINKYKSPPANFLDFGCDRGFLLEEARRFGYKVFGIELSQGSKKYCQKNGLTIYDDIELLNEKVDIVTMNHSLEHLIEPVQFLSQLKKHLAKDAIISIRVPDFGSFWSKLLKSKWIWFQPHNHYFHYTTKTLTYLLENNGFGIVFIRKRKAINFLGYKSNIVANKAYKKYFNQKPTLRNRLGFYYSWLTGSEIFAIARNKDN